jgi:nicotinic acid mononucleotide adenylyltransferase
MKELYKFFKFNGKVVDITDFEEENLEIFSREILKMISNGQSGWESMVPDGIADIIKTHHLFGYHDTKELAEK